MEKGKVCHKEERRVEEKWIFFLFPSPSLSLAQKLTGAPTNQTPLRTRAQNSPRTVGGREDEEIPF